MKRILLTLLAISPFLAKGQDFNNGSLEPDASSTYTICADNDVSHINSIKDVFLYVGAPFAAYVADASCPSGPAELGTHYIGLFYSPTYHAGSQILLRLNAPMAAGQPFKFSFYYKGRPPAIGNAADLEYGYGMDSTGAGDTSAGTISAPTVYDVWQKIEASVTPVFSGSKYIYVRVTTPSSSTDSAITFIDNFSSKNLNVEEVTTGSSLSLYPNPVRNTATLTLDYNIQLPCRVSICDLSGRSIYNMGQQNARKIPINKNGLAEGVYFIKVKDNAGKEYTTKMMVE